MWCVKRVLPGKLVYLRLNGATILYVAQKRLSDNKMNESQLNAAIKKLTDSLKPKERKKRDEEKERKWKEEEEERLKDPDAWASQLRDRRVVHWPLP